MKKDVTNNSIISDQVYTQLETVMSELSANGKTAIFLRYSESLNSSEISEIMNIPEGEVHGILSISEDYLMEEMDNANILEELPEFFQKDINKELVNEAEPVEDIPRVTYTKSKKVNFRKIILIAAAITLLSSFVVFALTFLLPNDSPSEKEEGVPTVEIQEDKDPQTPTDEAISNEKITNNDVNQSSNEKNSTPNSTNSTVTPSPKGDEIQGKNGQIIFTSKDCDCGHVNPTDVVISGLTGEEENFSWEITSNKTGKVVASGNGIKIAPIISGLYSDGKNGNYLLTIKYKDIEGNGVWIKRIFTIDTSKIGENEYS